MCGFRSFRPTEGHERAGFVWLWASGMPVRDIAVRSGTSVTTVYRWIRRWQREGHVNSKTRNCRLVLPTTPPPHKQLSPPGEPVATSFASSCASVPSPAPRPGVALPGIQTGTPNFPHPQHARTVTTPRNQHYMNNCFKTSHPEFQNTRRMSAWVEKSLAVCCVALLARLSIGEAPRPRGRGETLEAAGAAAAAVLARAWQPHCCVIMVTDGAASTHAVTKALRQMAAPWGAAVLEVRPGADGPNDSLPLLRRVLRQAREVSHGEGLTGGRGVKRQAGSDKRVTVTVTGLWCPQVTVTVTGVWFPQVTVTVTGVRCPQVTVTVTGVWCPQLVALTGLPKDRLRHLHTSFSHVNAVLIVSDGGASPRCEVVVHLPYSEQVVQVARWRPARLILASSLPLFPDKFHRFLERPSLRLTGEEFPPHVVLQRRAHPAGGTRLVFSGAMMSVLGVLAHSLNFRCRKLRRGAFLREAPVYNLVRPPDGSFGTRLPNGSGTGMVGMVSRQRPLVWVGLVVALVVVMAIVLLLARCLSLHSPALAPYVRVLLQENSWLPALWGWERLVLGGWMLAMLVVTQSYTGNLMSLLAVRYIPQPFQTLRALLDDSATTMIWEYGTASVNKFRTAEFGILREVGESEAAGRIMFVLATEYLNILRGLVRSGTHAFIGEDLTARVLMAQEFSRTGKVELNDLHLLLVRCRCDFYASREVFMPFLFCMIGPKHSPPRVQRQQAVSDTPRTEHYVVVARTPQGISQEGENLSVTKVRVASITWITEAGLYNHWMDSLSSNWTVCERAPSRITVRTRLGLGNVWGMFAILVVGNALSLLLFLVEVLTGHHLHSLLTVTSSWT
ncbi:hypothetical protein O3P69_014103 [Scylla paramamosain]|uniref:Ionotropic glutamate receptor C-terminal domain-containing protein n=1 Tax=Scylla paramamosain TaxID=85552 RepID=A0AAW0ST12_SCYPA